MKERDVVRVAADHAVERRVHLRYQLNSLVNAIVVVQDHKLVSHGALLASRIVPAIGTTLVFDPFELGIIGYRIACFP